jgi:hypothetical protein
MVFVVLRELIILSGANLWRADKHEGKFISRILTGPIHSFRERRSKRSAARFECLDLHNNAIVTCVPITRQRLGKHIPATNAHVTIGHPLLCNGPVITPP